MRCVRARAEYAPPELARGQGRSFASDWWALGAVLYQLVAGATPFCAADAEGDEPSDEQIFRRLEAYACAVTRQAWAERLRAELERRAPALTPAIADLVLALLDASERRRLRWPRAAAADEGGDYRGPSLDEHPWFASTAAAAGLGGASERQWAGWEALRSGAIAPPLAPPKSGALAAAARGGAGFLTATGYLSSPRDDAPQADGGDDGGGGGGGDSDGEASERKARDAARRAWREAVPVACSEQRRLRCFGKGYTSASHIYVYIYIYVIYIYMYVCVCVGMSSGVCR